MSNQNNLNRTKRTLKDYFPNYTKAKQFIRCCQQLNLTLSALSFSSPVKYIYNPTEYASDTFEKYVHSYGNSKKEILFLGMNPGPWGMSQTGVPFGEIRAVRNWLKIYGIIRTPRKQHPHRPILGFQCGRSEVSGKRFWALAKQLSETPEKFFNNCFVHNYCPLQFIASSGENVTPIGLKLEERNQLYEICDTKLTETIKIFDFKILIGIGNLAKKRLDQIKRDHSLSHVEVYKIPHPSPRVTTIENWQENAYNELNSFHFREYFKDLNT